MHRLPASLHLTPSLPLPPPPCRPPAICTEMRPCLPASPLPACPPPCRSRTIFLHVIMYNTAAIRLYDRSHFQCMGRLANFYYIASGRQPNPHQVRQPHLQGSRVCVSGSSPTPGQQVRQGCR